MYSFLISWQAQTCFCEHHFLKVKLCLSVRFPTIIITLEDKAGLETLLAGSLFKPSKFGQEEENLQK
jgi:hypothetical protein